MTPKFTRLTRKISVLYTITGAALQVCYYNGIVILLLDFLIFFFVLHCWSVDYCRNIEKDTVVEVGKGISPSFPEVLKLLLAQGEYLAFAPDTDETKNMIDILSLKFPELRVSSLLDLMLYRNIIDRCFFFSVCAYSLLSPIV